MKYLLDANVFMAANNLHYGLDFCPAFWDWLIVSNAQRKVFSIEKVGNEISATDDAFTGWAEEPGKHLFLKPDPEALKCMTQVSQWVEKHGYTPVAVNNFLQLARIRSLPMAGIKSMTLTVHVHSEVKGASGRHRAGACSLANVIEVMIHHYNDQKGQRITERATEPSRVGQQLPHGKDHERDL